MGENQDFTVYIRPESRKYALGALIQFELSSESVDLEEFQGALREAGVMQEIIEKLRAATPAEAFSTAVQTRRKYAVKGDTSRTLASLFLGREKVEEDSPSSPCYALNVFEPDAPERKNRMRQAGSLRLIGDVVTYEEISDFDTTFFGPEDRAAIQDKVFYVEAQVATETGRVTRDRLRDFLGSAAGHLGAFRYIGVGNSFFIPNPQYMPGGSPELSPDNPFEVIRRIFEVTAQLFPKNSLAFLPIFPDPEDEALSQTALARKCAANDVRRRMAEAGSKLAAILVRDKNASGASLLKRRQDFEKIQSDMRIYQQVLGLEISDMEERIREAEALLTQREKAKLGLDESVVAAFKDRMGSDLDLDVDLV